MPWRSETIMSLRREFIHMAMRDGRNVRSLCHCFGISRKTGYKWIHRFLDEGEAGLEDRSRRPKHSPAQTSKEMEDLILEVRDQHPAWGGRKIRQRLNNMGHTGVPTASTITEVLRRHERLDPEESSKHSPFRRFERPEPNDLWQMDFKGNVACPEGRCHPLTILDDCSRYAISLKACEDESGGTVQSCLIEAFQRYGMPREMLMDNAGPWGHDLEHISTPLTLWLMQLDVRVLHSRPYHPQTLGKDERFHRTLKAELVGVYIPWPREECQHRFDEWRMRYNWERPHESLDMDVPGSRYHVSSREFPEVIPEIEYRAEDIVRKVQHSGRLSYRGRTYKVPKSLYGQRVALRPRRKEDDIMDVYFCRQRVATINLREDH
jgi:transposase InsO family protein